MVVSDPFLFSYSLDGLGGGAALHDGAVSRLLKDDQLTWAHLNADHPHTATWLPREKASHYLEFNQLASEMVTAKSASLLQKINH